MRHKRKERGIRAPQALKKTNKKMRRHKNGGASNKKITKNADAPVLAMQAPRPEKNKTKKCGNTRAVAATKKI